MRRSTKKLWSVVDEHKALMVALQLEIGRYMGEAHSAEFIERNLGPVPKIYGPMLTSISRFICISSRGGKGALHMMTLLATREHWDANFALKDYLMQATRVSRDASREIRDLLTETGAGCLADLLKSEKAA